MPTDSEPTTAEERSPAPHQVPPKKKKKKKAKIARPLEEHEINAPDIQTLLMMGSLAALTVVLWIFAHAGCNYHPPRETRVPRKVTTADLTREPKDAAIELQQRLALLDYKGALEIAAGPLAKEIEAEKAACEKDRAACDSRKVANQKAISMGVVLSREPMSAKVRVMTHRLPDGVKRYLTLVERDASGWKITARVPDEPGAELPPPSISPSLRFTTSPHGLAPGMPGALTLPPGASASAAKPASPANTPPAPPLPPGHP
jgi:hypothetical protein